MGTAALAVATYALATDLGNLSTDLAGIIGGLAALLVVAAAAREGYRRTLGRRRDRYARLERLGTGAQLSFFIAVLGEPPAMRRRFEHEVKEIDADDSVVHVNRPFVECFFVDRDFYVQTLSDDDETVLGFSVTTRSRRFAPVFPGRLSLWERVRRNLPFRERYEPLFRVKLGRTLFPATDSEWGPPGVKAWLGAHAYSYSEVRYFGNPGYYQTYVFSASSASGGQVGDLTAVIGGSGDFHWPPEGAEPEDFAQNANLQRFRESTPITTFTVIGAHISAENYPAATYGPHGDEMRTIP